jgi:hypothetical protein
MIFLFLLVNLCFAGIVEDLDAIIAQEKFVQYAPWKVLGLAEAPSKEEFKKKFKKMAIKFHPDKFHQANDELSKKATQAMRVLIEAMAHFENIRFAKDGSGTDMKPPKHFSKWSFYFKGETLYIYAEDDAGFHEIVYSKTEMIKVYFRPTKLTKIPFEQSSYHRWLMSSIESIKMMAVLFKKDYRNFDSFKKIQYKISLLSGKLVYDVLGKEYQNASYRGIMAIDYARKLFEAHFNQEPPKKESPQMISQTIKVGKVPVEMQQTKDSMVEVVTEKDPQKIDESVKRFKKSQEFNEATPLNLPGSCDKQMN